MPDLIEPYAKKSLPNYEVVPLRNNEITVAALQMTTKTVDAKNPKPILKENLEHMLWLVDAAQRRGPVDLLCFPEFTLQGTAASVWTREEMLRIAIELPGEETELIGKKAKQYNCYIVVSCYTKEKDWSGHFFNASFMIGPSGEVIQNHWKAHFDPGYLEHATSVHDVLDEFVERYGWDAVWPVARTDIGNIAHYTCSEGFAPETPRVFAFKGAEILVWCLTGGEGREETHNIGQTYFQRNDVYGILIDAALRPPSFYAWETSGCGLSYIFDNAGRTLERAHLPHETVIRATIPIAAFRKKHSIPVLRKELYAPVYADYVGKYPPNMYSEYLPKDPLDGINYARKKARW